jgi:hypothetical protein
LTFAWQPRRDSEAGKPYAVVVVDEHIFRFNVLMYESIAMDLSECSRQSDSDTQSAGHVERLPVASFKNPIQWLTARIFEYEDRPSLVTCERERFGCPFRIDFACERVFAR